MTKQTDYRSDMDKFLEEFDKNPQAHSESRANEEKKYENINKLRDEVQPESKKSKLWKDF